MNFLLKATVLFSLSGQLSAIDIDTLPHPHRENLPVEPGQALLASSCADIDQAITYLIPATYQYKADMYENDYDGAAIWTSLLIKDLLINDIAYLYLPYSWFIGYQEENRQHQAFYQIEKLRRAKAMKQCFVQ